MGWLATMVRPVSGSVRRSLLPTTVGATSPASSGTATWNVPSNIDRPRGEARHSASLRP